MSKRATRNKKSTSAQRAETLCQLEAENLRLREEIERLRLRGAGAHPGVSLAEAMAQVDDAGDTADEAVTMYASSMLIRSELLELLAMLKGTVSDFEQRLERLDHRSEFPFTALQGGGDSEDRDHLNGAAIWRLAVNGMNNSEDDEATLDLRDEMQLDFDLDLELDEFADESEPRAATAKGA